MSLKSSLIALLVLMSCGVQTIKNQGPIPQKTTLIADGFIFRDNTNVRRQPGTKSMVAFTLNDGTPVVIRENKNGWYLIQTADDRQGWVRSDFVGPEMLSYAKRAEKFHEKVLPKYKATLYIDEKKPYAVVYLVLKPAAYTSKKTALKEATAIGKLYQRDVYPGKVEIRVMRGDRKTLFVKKTFRAIGPVRLKAPLLRVGRLDGMALKKRRLQINILVPESLKNKQLLKMARNISAAYGDDIRRIDIFMVTADGKGFFKTGKTPQNKSACRLHFLEDANGEDYFFNFCK